MFAGIAPSSFVRTLGAAAVGLALVTAPSLGAQQLPGQEMPPEMQAMIQEYQETEARLQELRQEAIDQNEELQSAYVAVGDMIEDAMREVEPELDQVIERLQAMQVEAQQAQQSQDMERLQALMGEAEGLQNRWQAAQAGALERDDVREAVESFEEDLMQGMVDIDPEAEEMQERLEELAERLNSMMPTM
ncbi:MAG: hypothetical protein EA422_01590 [Gemmatimonadales bacterium]|nr:MAG: hypothetical protein EA422_01590 [Gemmatimonadales bacterium]